MMTASLPTPTSADAEIAKNAQRVSREMSPGNLPPLHSGLQGPQHGIEGTPEQATNLHHNGNRERRGTGTNSSSGSDGAEAVRIDSSTQRAISRPMMVSMQAQNNVLPPLRMRSPTAHDAPPAGSSPVPFMRLGSNGSGMQATPNSGRLTPSSRTMVRRPSVAMDGSAQAEEMVDTETHIESAMEGYQHALNQEARSKKRSKRLKLVLLGIFRDCADIFELDWLTKLVIVVVVSAGYSAALVFLRL